MSIRNVPELIFLCGFMGAGKSTIGKKIAARLEVPFIDLDDAIVESAGQSIPAIFNESGEAGFRSAERRALLEIIRTFEGIVALGGGTLQNQHLLDHIKLNGVLIFVETPMDVIIKRISQDANRPLLLDEQGNPKDRQTLTRDLQELYDERLPFYQQAVIKLQNDGTQSLEELVKKLEQKISNHVDY